MASNAPPLATTALHPPVEDPTLEFRAGVTAVLRTWSALRTAVMEGWGGWDSVEKAEDLRRNVFEAFGSTRTRRLVTLKSAEELEENLAAYLEEEFSVVLEDDSSKQVADVIWNMYEQCCNGDVRSARALVANAARLADAKANEKVVVRVEGEMDEDDDDDDDDDDENVAGDGKGSAMEVDGGDDNDAMKAGDAEAAAQIPPAAATTNSIATSPFATSPASTVMTAAKYLEDRLFETEASLRRRKAAEAAAAKPVRQLGEAVEALQEEEVDEDGFATVRRSRRSTKGKREGINC